MGATTRSSVGDAVLSVVIQKPSYGYDIGTRFVARYQGLFRSTVQHVYKELDRLEQRDLIEAIDPAAEGISGVKRQPKVSYRGTAAGAKHYREWLGADLPSDLARRELFIRLRAVRPNDYRAMLNLLERYEEAVLRSIDSTSGAPSVSIVDAMAQEDVETSIEAALRWVASAREMLHAKIAHELSR